MLQGDRTRQIGGDRKAYTARNGPGMTWKSCVIRANDDPGEPSGPVAHATRTVRLSFPTKEVMTSRPTS